MDSCRHQKMVLFWGRGFAVPVPVPRLDEWVGAAGSSQGWVPTRAEAPNRNSCPHITLVLGTGPAVPAAPPHPGEMLLLFLKHLLKAAAFFAPSPFKALRQSVEGSLFGCCIRRQLLSSMDNLAGSAVMQCQLSKLQGALG